MTKQEWIEKALANLPDDADILAWNITAHEPEDPKSTRDYLAGTDTNGLSILMHIAQTLHSTADRMGIDPQTLAETALKIRKLDDALGAQKIDPQKEIGAGDKRSDLLAKLMTAALLHNISGQGEDNDDE